MEVIINEKEEQTQARVGDFLYVQWDEEYFIYQVILGVRDSQDNIPGIDRPYALVEVDSSFDDGNQDRFTICHTFRDIETFQVGKAFYKPTGAIITKIFPYEKAKLTFDL